MVLVENDRDVIEAAQRGDADAFHALFETHKDKVYSVALRYAGNHAAAMDIAQDTFLKLLSCIRNFRGEANFDSWLYRIVVNRCLDHQRRGRRHKPFFDGLLGRASTDNALREILRTEVQHDIQNVIGTLSPDHRIVVILRYTEGLSYDQISEVLGCSRGTIASRLNRAHKILERRLSHLRGDHRA